MKQVKISVNFQGKIKIIKVKKLSFFGMIRGLTFRKKDFRDILLFNFNNKIGYSIHSYFVFFDFLALWLDDKNNVCYVKKVKPFTLNVKPNKPFYRLIEIPVQKSNKKLVDFFVGKRKI